ncbi:MAG: hypothetical protein QOI03_1398 [Solirubrobacteraceae bacterium]|jgi:hypothetical protein|nr:hypothetical protein [Solirubrobacteraceae bacterium]
MRSLTAVDGRRSGAQGRARGPVARAAVIAAVAACAAVASSPAIAQAASNATVTTGPAKEVGDATAVLTGAVNPNGSDTSYYFQYGPTRTYGLQSTIVGAGAGTRAVPVRLTVSGLAPITQYHYRLVAVNGAGAAAGKDQAFLTKKVPLSLGILTSPNPVLFGGTVLIQGTLAGTGNAGQPVVLQANAFPFTAGFQNVGNAELTSATGTFSFAVPAMSVVTQFRVRTVAKAVLSLVATESVAVRVSSHIGHARRRHFARFYGTVVPAEDGAHIAILRIVHGHNVLVAGTTLRHRNATSSQFSRTVRVRAGVYHVLVVVTSGAQTSNYGPRLKIG